MNNLEQILNDFLLSEKEDIVGFIDNLRESYSLDSILDSIYEILINMFLNTEKNNVFLRNRILMFLNTILKTILDIEKSDLVLLDNLLGQTSYLTNFEGLDDALVAEFIYRRNTHNRINLVNKETILEESEIEETTGLSTKTNYLQESELFGIHAYDLLPFYYFNLDRKLAFMTPSFINYNPLFRNAFLIFSYLGNGLCREFYTGKVVNIIDENKVDLIYSIDNEDSLDLSVKFFQDIKKSPLVIKSTISKINDKYEVDENFKRIILEQSEQREQITAAINEMFDKVDKKNKANITKLVNEDYDRALELDSLESDLIAFKKDTKRLFLEQTSEKSS